MIRTRTRWMGTAALVLACLTPSPLFARSATRLGYARADVWATAVRLLRVNQNLVIREKDETAGYVLFDFADGGKTYRASLELVSTGDGPGVPPTDVILTIAELPRRFETQLLDRLSQKLRDERGVPNTATRGRGSSANEGGSKNGNSNQGGQEPKAIPDGGLPRLPQGEHFP